MILASPWEKEGVCFQGLMGTPLAGQSCTQTLPGQQLWCWPLAWWLWGSHSEQATPPSAGQLLGRHWAPTGQPQHCSWCAMGWQEKPG